MANIGKSVSFKLDDERSIVIESGKLAKQADGSVTVRMGDTILLATIVTKNEAAENVDFLPLSVDYQEKYASNGRIPGGFFKREARPSEYEILIARLIDRALRPLFPDDYHAETQVQVLLLSAEKNVLPDALACLAASAAIAVSDIPFNGPVAEARVGRINGSFVINPNMEQIAESDIDIMVAATYDNICMVEGELKEVSEDDLLEAMKFAHGFIKIQCKAQEELAAMFEKSTPKRTYCHENNDAELEKQLHDFAFNKLYEIAKLSITNKKLRTETFNKVKEEFLATLTEEEIKEKKPLVEKYFHDIHKEAVRKMILDDSIRLDGRAFNEIRPIWCEVDYLPSAHGSAIFTRGETQSLTTVTLGTKLDEQIIDGAVLEGKSNLMLHYNFPAFSTGEVKMNRGTSRREIGHGNLALRAVRNMIPTGEANPYTVRIVSDILESNGSSSMATVCAATLSLMDAGVKLKKPVSGIAMGLIYDEKTDKFAVLSDILGDEDHLGDMDFKVTGTQDGITACQMDIKVNGLSYEVLSKALAQAKEGREHILRIITETISAPREEYKPHVPRIIKMTIPKEFIGAIIGPGGKIIQEMQRETGATIMIEEAGEFGIIDIASNNQEATDAVIAKIKGIIAVPEVGATYTGKVKSLMSFGAFVEFMPGKDGLLHISEIDYKRYETVEETGIKEGDILEVKLLEVDKKTGKYRLSKKALITPPEGYVAPPERKREDRDSRGGRDNRGGRDGRDNRNNRR